MVHGNLMCNIGTLQYLSASKSDSHIIYVPVVVCTVVVLAVLLAVVIWYKRKEHSFVEREQNLLDDLRNLQQGNNSSHGNMFIRDIHVIGTWGQLIILMS